jgi:hypothetical protein
MTVNMADDVQVKGTTITSTLRFLEERYGAEGVAQVVGALSESDQKLLKDGFVDRRFYPFRVLVELMRVSKKIHSLPSDYYQQLGRASADYAMSVFLRAIFKVASPEFIINQGAVLYGSFYTSGRIRVTGASKGSCSLHLERFAAPCPEFCHRVWGWSVRMLELAGGRDIKSHKVACLCNGDPACRIDATWT